MGILPMPTSPRAPAFFARRAGDRCTQSRKQSARLPYHATGHKAGMEPPQTQRPRDSRTPYYLILALAAIGVGLHGLITGRAGITPRGSATPVSWDGVPAYTFSAIFLCFGLAVLRG